MDDLVDGADILREPTDQRAEVARLDRHAFVDIESEVGADMRRLDGVGAFVENHCGSAVGEKGRAAERFRLRSAWLYPSAGMTRIRFVGLEKLLSAPVGHPVRCRKLTRVICAAP